MFGFLFILGCSFLYTVLVAIIHISRDGWHSAYGRGERINIVVTTTALVGYGAYVLVEG